MILATLLVMLLENTMSSCELRQSGLASQLCACSYACLRPVGHLSMHMSTCLASPYTHPLPPRCLLSADNMQVYGWRIPFLLAFGTAVLGYWLRAGLPEPKTFLAAARAEKELEEKAKMADGDTDATTMHSVPSSKRCAWWLGVCAAYAVHARMS